MSQLNIETLRSLLGHPDGYVETQAVLERGARRDIGGIRCESVQVRSPGTPLPGLLLSPPAPGNRKAILYCHAHGNRYDIGKSEILSGRPALCDPPLGLALAQAGYIVLCIDMPGFGARRNQGGESALAKAALWQGRPLIGDMLADQALALQALAAADGVDRARIATVGISMGATLAYMLAALRPDIAATAHLCAFAQMGPLIATRAHDLHGIYMVIPGLLPAFDMADIAALIAPRPQLICAGGRDPLTPAPALDPALGRLREAYRDQNAPAALTSLCDPAAGHAETAQFRAAVMRFLAESLGP